MILLWVVSILSLNLGSLYAAEKKSEKKDASTQTELILTEASKSYTFRKPDLMLSSNFIGQPVWNPASEEFSEELQQLHTILTLFKNPILCKSHWLNYQEELLKTEPKSLKNSAHRAYICNWQKRHAGDLALLEERRKELGAQLHPIRCGKPHEQLRLGFIKANYGEHGSGLWEVRSYYIDRGCSEVHYCLRPEYPHSLPLMLTLKMIYDFDKGPQRPYLS